MTYSVMVNCANQEMQDLDKCELQSLKEAKNYCDEIAGKKVKNWEKCEDYISGSFNLFDFIITKNKN